MRIQHNLQALNSHRNLGINNSFTSKNLEKLSSGYRINRAGDDAAGLAISEKMRGQIRGLEMAEQNTSNGINLIQTAEGGLNETHAILQRMRELAVQSSNGTYQDTDREQLTKEFQALKSEVDRISESTHYNGIKLLDGSLDTANRGVISNDVYSMMQNFQLGNSLSVGDTVTLKTGDYVKGSVATAATAGKNDAGTIGATVPAGLVAGDVLRFEVAGTTYETTALTASDITTGTNVAQAMVDAINRAGGSSDWTVSQSAGKIEFTAKDLGSAAGKVAVGNLSISNLYNVTKASNAATDIPAFTAGAGYVAGNDEVLKDPTIEDGTTTVAITVNKYDGTTAPTVTATARYDRTNNSFVISDSIGNTFTLSADAVKANEQEATFTVVQGDNLVFQIGANGGQDQRVNLGVANMSSKNIGLRAGDIKSDGNGAVDGEAEMLATASIDTIVNANKAIDIIHAATDQVSGQRAELGALQNRLEHTMNNLGVTKENLTAAESTIRDVDMAKEMMDFTKNNILIQASQAMLAQANQLPQGVLQLLR